MISIFSFISVMIHFSLGYTNTKNIPVFSCVYVPELFIDLEDICSAKYDCWNSQFRDYSRYFLSKRFAVFRSLVATATCNQCDNGTRYSNMFLMYYHWRLEHMAIHLTKKFKCPFLNKTRSDIKESRPAPLIFDNLPDDLPKIDRPQLEPNFQGYRYHFAGFTLKLNKKSNHRTMLRRISRQIFSDNMNLNLFDSWNSSGHYTLASATFFGCTLIQFVNVTGKTTLDEDVSNEHVAYFACVFAGRGQLWSQPGELNAISCLESSAIHQHRDGVSLCAERRTAEEETWETPCQIYYNNKEIKEKTKSYKSCSETSSNWWKINEAPQKNVQFIEVYFSDNDVTLVSVTSLEKSAKLSSKEMPLIYFSTIIPSSNSSSKTVSKLITRKLDSSRIKYESNVPQPLLKTSRQEIDLQKSTTEKNSNVKNMISATMPVSLKFIGIHANSSNNPSNQGKKSEELEKMDDVEEIETLVTSPSSNETPRQRDDDLMKNFLQWLSCLSTLGYFLFASPFFLILLVILIAAHDQHP